jgi:hypothetical protein
MYQVISMFRSAGYTKYDGTYVQKTEVAVGSRYPGVYQSDAHRYKQCIHLVDKTGYGRGLSPVRGVPMRAKDTLLASIMRNSKSFYSLKHSFLPDGLIKADSGSNRVQLSYHRDHTFPTAKPVSKRSAMEAAKQAPKLVGRLVSVEIECYYPHGKFPVDNGLTEVGNDGSLDSGGIEIKRMTWASNGRLMGLLSLEKQLQGYRINKKCGVHIHIDARHLPNHSSDTKLLTASETYDRLTLLYPMLKKLVSESRLRNRYCRWVNNNHESDRFDAGVGRYAAINFEAYKKYKTIEFRCANGSTNVVKIESWALLCRHLFDWCSNRENSVPTNWSSFLAILPSWMASWCVLRNQRLHGNVGPVDARVASALDFAPGGNVE